MKVLVTIANYGSKNDHYLHRLLHEYASMSHDVHVVVLTNVPKALGENVEVIVRTPQGDPWSFPFAHKKILADRINEFDVFIYSEDDTLITEKHINAFLRATEVLRDNEIAGFIRSERSGEGDVYLSTINHFFHWDPDSVVSRGDHIFAYFTNEHSASYILTRNHLKAAIDSGGFLVEPHSSRYDLLVTAATDPYTQCGLTKLICISEIEDFILPHLPNKYVGQMGLGKADLLRQITALESIYNKARPSTVLMNTETRLPLSRWSKSYYELPRQKVLDVIQNGNHEVLSFGCGWGAMEAELQKKGLGVTAVVLDSVIGACAEARGLEVVYGDSECAIGKMGGKQFDYILALNILHLTPDPIRLLASLRKLVAPGGTFIATLPNLSELSVHWHQIMRHPGYIDFGKFDRTGIHKTSLRLINKWFAAAGFRVRDTIPSIPKRAQFPNRLLGKMSNRWLSEEFIVVAKMS
jgi:SAM-dependent methyltransferase